MQLQLSLKVADRLHQALLIHGRPLDPAQAVHTLVAAEVGNPLCDRILELLIREDSRFCWADTDPRALSLRMWEMPDPRLTEVPFVALDLETTGARAGIGKITEIGALRMEGLRVVAEFSTLVNPLRPIPPMITRITGITPSMVAGAPRIEEVIPRLLDFMDGAVIVAHNAPFDVGFLNYELRRLGSRALGEGAVDTLPLARTLVPGLANYRLGTVAQALGAPVTACHRALADAQAVGHVFVELIDRLQRHGVTHLGEMRAYAGSSSRSCLGKLSLTRDLPSTPGTYRFLDDRGHVLLVGSADSLAEAVRSHFVGSRRRSSKERTAARLVEHIDWQGAPSPLEAAVQEHSLVLEHLPPYNLFLGRPERYAYIRAASVGSGLSLSTSRRAVRRPPANGDAPEADCSDLVIGPFRRMSTAKAAIDLLRFCYPIKQCPRKRHTRPCPRGEAGRCLSPCAEGRYRTQEHDDMVRALVCWLAGHSRPELRDPVQRAEELARELAGQERFDESRAIREACGDLQNVRRSYAALAEARALCAACLWPQSGNGASPSVRVNLVWEGALVRSVSLTPDTMEQHTREMIDLIGSLAAPLAPGDRSLTADGESPLVAVPQTELDSLLAIARWYRVNQSVVKIPIPNPISDLTALAGTCGRIEAELQTMLSR